MQEVFTVLIFTGDCVCVILGHKNDHRLKKIEEKSNSRILYEYVVIF